MLRLSGATRRSAIEDREAPDDSGDVPFIVKGSALAEHNTEVWVGMAT
jgi:hypothetical protein